MTTPPASSSELDAADALAPYRDRFLRDPEVLAYLDGNSLGRPLVASRDRVADFITDQWATRLIRGWGEGWMALPECIGDDIGRVALGAAPSQVIVGDSTTVLLYKLIRAAVDARPDRSEIVIDRDNFPTDRYVVEGIAAERGLTVRWLEGIDPALGVTTDILVAALSDRTAVVVVSHVAYRSGFIADVPAITSLARDAGALVVWDLSHSVGSVPTRLDEWEVDLATGCTYKYLNGGPGSPAFAYVRAELQKSVRQPIQGWLGAADSFEMGQGYRAAVGIRGFISGTPPILGMLALQDMLALLDEVGMDAVRTKSRALTAFAIDLADELIPDAQLASPRDPERRGSHITLELDGAREIVPKLWAQGVIPDFRTPDGIRIGLSPLSTSFAEVELGMFALAHP
ncbi:MAG: hypothetical protein RI885_2329 [Actinomycetota bacterium]|jgi:kynureninase